MRLGYSIRTLFSPSRLYVRYDIKPRAWKRAPTVVFLHGIGNDARTWDTVLENLPQHGRYIALDLLGFGDSPKPSWEIYDAKSHAKALERTLWKLAIDKPVIIVGHSLGALVAVEYARKHPRSVKRLILCSPPFYQPTTRKTNKTLARDELYRKLYQMLRKRSHRLVVPAKLYSEYLSLNKGRNINENTLPAFVKSLEASIENQQSFNHIQHLKTKTDILYGRLDALLIKKNLDTIQQANPNYIKLHSITAGHEIVGYYAKFLSRYIKKTITHSRSV